MEKGYWYKIEPILIEGTTYDWIRESYTSSNSVFYAILPSNRNILAVTSQFKSDYSPIFLGYKEVCK